MKKISSTLLLLSLFIVVGIVSATFQHKKHQAAHTVSNTTTTNDQQAQSTLSIDQLTNEKTVIAYLRLHNSLPPCYISKNEARRRGWDAGKANLCEVLPGRAIGGDVFSNREEKLPTAKGRVWHEADLNYACGHRNGDRLLFSSDKLYYVTYDHYQTFKQR